MASENRTYRNPVFPKLDLDDLHVGDRVRLWYTGSGRVPLWLANHWATIAAITGRGLLLVTPDIEGRIRRIRRDEDVCEVWRDGFSRSNPNTGK